MRQITKIDDMRAAAAEAVRAGKRVALVPTMGALHEGHLALVAEARRRADIVVLSVFVNPLQFAPGEDFDSYPRDLARDRSLAESAGVDLLWTPSAEEMYAEPPQVTVAPGPIGTILEGAVRPSHFAGMLTVVCKLFAIAQPDVAVFGRKDAQQAALVRFMVRDLSLRVEIAVAPTMRDADGLALSSRNVYLDAAMREKALVLPRALAAGVDAFRKGERRAGQVIAAAYKVLGPAESAGDVVTEYINVVDAESFLPNHAAQAASYLVAAIRVGKKRLIDNVVLGQGIEADPRVSAHVRAGA
jgi:pantoate--beta-alanine ligase